MSVRVVVVCDRCSREALRESSSLLALEGWSQHLVSSGGEQHSVDLCPGCSASYRSWFKPGAASRVLVPVSGAV